MSNALSAFEGELIGNPVAQAILARALRSDRDAIDRTDVLKALDAITTLLRTAPAALAA